MSDPAAPLSDARLAEIRSVQLGAWYSREWHLRHPSGNTGPVQIVHSNSQGDTVLAELPDFAVDIAVFIADAHEAVPELLAEVDRLRALTATLEQDSATLSALEAAGVDSWDGYDDAVAGASR
jgi:hypothetical protein